MKYKILFYVLFFILLAGCFREHPEKILKSFPMDTTEGLIIQSGIEIDTNVYQNGSGSLKINAKQPQTIRLFEFEIKKIKNTRLVYRAFLKLQNFQGQVFLEMWCHFPDKGEFFSRNLYQPLSGTTDWTMVETPFFLKQGEIPDRIKLNLIANGTGTVWMDRITLLKSNSEPK